MRTRYGIDPVTGRSTLTVIEQTVTARLGDQLRRRHAAVSLELTRWTARPESVRLAVLPAGGVWAGGWWFPRELLAAGLTRRAVGWVSNDDWLGPLAADFDAVTCRDQPAARVLRVMSKRGPAALAFRVWPVAEFLDKTYGLHDSRFGTEVDS